MSSEGPELSIEMTIADGFRGWLTTSSLHALVYAVQDHADIQDEPTVEHLTEMTLGELIASDEISARTASRINTWLGENGLSLTRPLHEISRDDIRHKRRGQRHHPHGI